jgi:nucleotide-binding universal stress UspA family protein
MRTKGLSTVMASIERRVREGFNDEMGEAPYDMQLIKAVRVLQDDSPLVILADTQKVCADLLVIGSHSHGTAWDTPLGHTAQRLVQLSESPVYLVPMLRHRGLGEL